MINVKNVYKKTFSQIYDILIYILNIFLILLNRVKEFNKRNVKYREAFKSFHINLI